MIVDKIHDLRLKYEAEQARLKNEHDRERAALNSALDAASKADYYTPYSKRYAELLSAMEQYLQRVIAIERDVHGLGLYVGKYHATAPVLPINEKDVEATFEQMLTQCGETVESIEKPHTREEYEELLKNYCKLLATVRHMSKNANNLLRTSGYPETDKKNAVADVQDKIDAMEAKYKEACKVENLECYDEIAALSRDLINTYKRTVSELLGNVTMGDDGKYRYLIGFKLEKPEEADARFCEEILGVEREKVGREPVYLEPRKGLFNIVINAPGEFLSSRSYDELVRNLYFTFASRLDKNMLQMGYIDCHRGPSVLQNMYTGMDTSDTNSGKRLGAEGTFCYPLVKDRDPSKINDCFDRIYNDCNDTIAHYGNVIDHNLSTEKNKVALKLVFVNFYPLGFSVNYGDNQPYSALQMQMQEYGDSGCMFVVCRDINAPLANDGMLIDAKRCNAIEINLDERSYSAWKSSCKPLASCEFTIDGMPATLNITADGFNGMQYWDQLKEFYSKKKVFSLRDIFARTAAAADDWRSPPSVFDDEVIEIPLGLKGAEEYSLRYPLSSAGHTLVYGGSGSGKSSFLHALILSLCYKYSSDDVHIYLADFKKTEFSFYARHQLPHIKYYLVKPGLSEACDVFDMIDRIRLERGSLLEKYDCADIQAYNRKVKRCTDGSMKKMPVLFFIVDEYQVIDSVTGADRNAMSRINKAIKTTLSQARAMGVNIFLCAQNINRIDEIGTENVKTYILMGDQKETDRYIRTYFLGEKSNMADLAATKEYLSIEKEGRCLIRAAGTTVADKVRVAYAGKEDEDKVRYVDMINELRSREEISIVLGGSEDPVKVSGEKKYCENMLEDTGKRFGIDLGVGSTSGFPSSITFDTNEKGDKYGWMVYSERSDCANNIIRNAILAFLYKTTVKGYKYRFESTKERVLYFADGRAHDEVLGERYWNNIRIPRALESNVKKLEIGTSMYELCEAITAMGEELKRREKEMPANRVYFSETLDYPPYLIVLQSLGWLTREAIDAALKEHYADDAAEQEKKADVSFDIDDIDTDNLGVNDDFIFSGFDIFEKPATQMRGSEVLKTLGELFERGSRYGIFVIVSPENRASAESVFGTKASERGAYWNNCVYGTFNEYINVSSEDDQSGASEASSMICYVGANGTKTRMYDYSPSTESAWWGKFIELMEDK